MPLETREVDLAEEVDRLTEQMEAKADEQADHDYGSDAALQAAEEGQQAERYRTGVLWAMEEAPHSDRVPFWTEEAESVTLAALTNGERHRVRDTVDETGWKLSDAYVAQGTYDAPYLEHDPEAVTEDEFRETVLNVTDLHPAFVDWAESRISDLGGVGGDTGKSYRELVLERRSQATSPTENG